MPVQRVDNVSTPANVKAATFEPLNQQRRLFRLDEAAFRRFAKALDAPPADNPRLRKLLAKRAPWER